MISTWERRDLARSFFILIFSSILPAFLPLAKSNVGKLLALPAKLIALLLALILVLPVICGFVVIGKAQSTNTERVDIAKAARPALRIFKDKDGLPQNSIMSMARDRQGYLWVGTQDGICHYNGRKWTIEKLPIGSPFIENILVASDGSIWLATDGKGIANYKDGKWQIYTTQSGLPSNQARTLIETIEAGKSVIWAGTIKGLARLQLSKGSAFQTVPEIGNTIVYALANQIDEHHDNTLWVGTESGLECLQNNHWTHFDIKDGLPGKTIHSLLVTTENGKNLLWVGTQNGLACLRNNHWSSFDTNSGLPNNQIQALAQTIAQDGTVTLWVGTSGGGLAWLHNNEWSILDNRTGLPNNQITSLLETSDEFGSHTLWIGTNGGGLARLQNGQWSTIDTHNGLPNNIVMNLLETDEQDGGHTLWVATYGGGLGRFQHGKWTTYDTSNVFTTNIIYNLLETQDGSHALWVATWGGGLMRFDHDHDRWTTFNTSSGLPNNFVISLLETTNKDGSHTLWAGTWGGGLACFHNGQWKNFNTENGLPSNQVICLLETKNDQGSTIWAGTNGGGLAFYRNNQWSTINNSSGLPDNTVNCLLTTRSTTSQQLLWVGTRGGVSRLDLSTIDNPSAKLLILSETTRPSLPNNTINQMRVDAKGRIYICTNRGVARLSPRQPTPEDQTEYQIYNFSTEDGLPSNECNQGAAMIDSRGRVWVGTVEGIGIFDPDKDVEGFKPKPLFIERAWAAGLNRALNKNETLSYKDNRISFEYSLLSYFREADTRYRTQLISLDKEPSDWSGDYKKEYPALQDGDYIFKVWGMDYLGNISGPIEYPFHINPAPWRTWSAYTLYFITIGCLVYGGVRFRVRRLQYYNEELKQLVAERTAEVVKQRDEIKEKNTSILDSIRYAERIQQAMLPHQEAIAATFTDHFILFKPKDIVSGDFYWFHDIDGIVVLAVADCTGHGVPGALMSMIGNALLSQIVAEKKIIDPALILCNLHQGIRYALKQNEIETEPQDGMDIALCAIDKPNHRVIFAGAKRPFYYFDEHGELIMIKGDRRSIGGKQREAQRQFTNFQIDYTKEITFYLTTDGFIDQNGTTQPRFGSERFKHLLRQHALDSMAIQNQVLLTALADFKGTEPQRDDITIVGVKI